MDMAIKWKDKFLQSVKNFGRELAVKTGSPEHTLTILAAALVFFCIELALEQWLFDNDFIVDILGAATGALSILLLRFAVVNARLYREAKTNSEILERRVSEIAHEFQTPIAILKGNLGILAESPPTNSSEWTDTLATASTTLDRLSRLVRTLLDVAKLHAAPNHVLARERLDARSLVQEICEDCSLLAEDRGIMLSFDADNSATPVMVIADRDKIKEVLLNLLGNAIKYTPRGGAISVEVVRRDDFVLMSVTDTGSGITPENLPHIFERFYRIAGGGEDSSNAHDGSLGGTGLGLYLSKQIVEAHGGMIIAESEFGRGSRFTVRLPTALDDRGDGKSVVI